PRHRVRRLDGRPADRRPGRAHDHSRVTLTEGAETLPQSIKRQTEAHERTSVLDFGYHFILQNKLSILDGIPEAVRMGVPSFKMFMTYKKRGDRMCSDDFICKALEVIGPAGGLAQFHCENGDVI